MRLTTIIEEYYSLFCKMNYLSILSTWALKDDENIQFIVGKILINDNFKNIDMEEILKYLHSSIDDNNLNH